MAATHADAIGLMLSPPGRYLAPILNPEEKWAGKRMSMGKGRELLPLCDAVKATE
jgi:hypothetical protein